MTDLKALTDEIEAAREALLGAFDAQGFATGHGDTLADLVMEFSIQSQDRAEAAEARATRAETDLSALMEGRASIVTMNGPSGSFPAISYHVEDPNAEVRDSETGEVIFPAKKAPFRVITSPEKA